MISKVSTENLQLKIGFDSQILDYGFREGVFITPFAPPHVAIIGNSGSGKTYLLKLLLGRISLHKEYELVLADFKGVDFHWLTGSRNFYQYAEVGTALDYVYNLMKQRMEHGGTRYMHPVFFAWDEMAAYLSMLPKKEAELQTQKFSALLMLGRGVSVCCILSMQRPDAAYFSRARDNIGNIVALGTLSEESKKMIAASYRDEIVPQPRGRGYLLTDGKAPRAITVPTVRDMEMLRTTVHAGLNRSW